MTLPWQYTIFDHFLEHLYRLIDFSGVPCVFQVSHRIIALIRVDKHISIRVSDPQVQ